MQEVVQLGAMSADPYRLQVIKRAALELERRRVASLVQALATGLEAGLVVERPKQVGPRHYKPRAPKGARIAPSPMRTAPLLHELPPTPRRPPPPAIRVAYGDMTRTEAHAFRQLAKQGELAIVVDGRFFKCPRIKQRPLGKGQVRVMFMDLWEIPA